MIGLCAKLGVSGCSFDEVSLDLTLSKKAKRGRKPSRRGCLVRDQSPAKIVNVESNEEIEENEESIEEVPDDNNEALLENEEVHDDDCEMSLNERTLIGPSP